MQLDTSLNQKLFVAMHKLFREPKRSQPGIVVCVNKHFFVSNPGPLKAFKPSSKMKTWTTNQVDIFSFTLPI
jgi:hypothetical protein